MWASLVFLALLLPGIAAGSDTDQIGTPLTGPAATEDIHFMTKGAGVDSLVLRVSLGYKPGRCCGSAFLIIEESVWPPLRELAVKINDVAVGPKPPSPKYSPWLRGIRIEGHQIKKMICPQARYQVAMNFKEWLSPREFSVSMNDEKFLVSRSQDGEYVIKPFPSNDQEDKILAASQAFSQAFVKGDTTSIRDLYTQDAVLMIPDRKVQGHEDILRFFAPSENRVNMGHSMESKDLEIHGDRALDIGTWNYHWHQKGQGLQHATGPYLVVWRRGPDDKWRIEYDMWQRKTQ